MWVAEVIESNNTYFQVNSYNNTQPTAHCLHTGILPRVVEPTTSNIVTNL